MHAHERSAEREEEERRGDCEVAPPRQENFAELDGTVLELKVGEDGCKQHATGEAKCYADDGLDSGLDDRHARNVAGGQPEQSQRGEAALAAGGAEDGGLGGQTKQGGDDERTGEQSQGKPHVEEARLVAVGRAHGFGDELRVVGTYPEHPCAARDEKRSRRTHGDGQDGQER